MLNFATSKRCYTGPSQKVAEIYYIVNHIQNLNIIAISFTKDDRIFMYTEIDHRSNAFIAGQNLRIKICYVRLFWLQLQEVLLLKE